MGTGVEGAEAAGRREGSLSFRRLAGGSPHARQRRFSAGSRRAGATGEWLDPTLLRGWIAADRINTDDTTGGRSLAKWLPVGLAHAGELLSRRPGYPPALGLRGWLHFMDWQYSGRGDQREIDNAERDLRGAAVPENPSAGLRLERAEHAAGGSGGVRGSERGRPAGLRCRCVSLGRREHHVPPVPHVAAHEAVGERLALVQPGILPLSRAMAVHLLPAHPALHARSQRARRRSGMAAGGPARHAGPPQRAGAVQSAVADDDGGRPGARGAPGQRAAHAPRRRRSGDAPTRNWTSTRRPRGCGSARRARRFACSGGTSPPRPRRRHSSGAIPNSSRSTATPNSSGSSASRPAPGAR